MVVLVPVFHARPECAEEVSERLRELANASRAEDGCLEYRLYVDATDPHTFILFEEWESEAALGAHDATPHVQSFLAEVQDELIEPFRVMRMAPA